jgi:hypothetical protein
MTEPATRPGAKFVPIPPEAGHIVDLALFQGKLFLACQYAVYEVIEAAYPEPLRLREILSLHRPGENTDG